MDGWQTFWTGVAILCFFAANFIWIYWDLSSRCSTICTKMNCIFQKKICPPNEQLNADSAPINGIYSLRENIRTPSEVNERHETFNNPHDISSFYENSVYLPRQVSNYPQEDRPPSYDQLFAAKKLNNCTVIMV